jgi:hypothetical protein
MIAHTIKNFRAIIPDFTKPALRSPLPEILIAALIAIFSNTKVSRAWRLKYDKSQVEGL